MTATEYQKFFDDFSKLPKQEKSDETFVSIIRGRADDERTSSNILAFFLDTTREHNLKDLFVKSLLEAADISINTSNCDFTAETEFYTQNAHFVDVLVRGNSVNIVIENKLFAPLHNDLKDYYESAKEEDKQDPIGIVLSLYKISTLDENVRNLYKCVTYDTFLMCVKKNMGSYFQDASKKYLPLLVDFINNIEGLQKMETLNREFAKFLIDYREQSVSFLNQVSTLNSVLKKNATDIKRQLDDRYSGNKFFTIQTWNEELELTYYLYVDFVPRNDDSMTIRFDSYVSVDSWYFRVWVSSNRKRCMDLSVIENVINVLNVDGHYGKKYKDKNEVDCFYFTQKFDIGDESVRIVNYIEDCLYKIGEKYNWKK